MPSGAVRQVKEFLRFYMEGSTRYDIHSPYLFRLATFILDPDRNYYEMAEMRPWRDLLERDQLWQDLESRYPGNRSKKSKSSFKNRFRVSCSSRWTADCLFRLIVFMKAKRVLILGSGNGIDVLLAVKAAGTDSTVIAVETDHTMFLRSRQFLSATPGNAQILNSVEKLSELPSTSAWDLVVVGKDFKASDLTVESYGSLVQSIEPTGAWVFPGIHGNHLNRSLWEKGSGDERVTARLCCWSFGILFFSPSFYEKLNISLVPWAWKPWRLGIWGGKQVNKIFPRTG